MNIVEIVKERSGEPSNTFEITFLTHILDKHSSLDYRSLDQSARCIAAKMQEKGLKRGDRALLLYAPGLDFIRAFMGCLYAGVIAVPMYPPLTRSLIDKLEEVIRNSSPSVLLSHSIITKEIRNLKYLKVLSKLPIVKSLISLVTIKHHDFMQSSISDIPLIETDTMNFSLCDSYKNYIPQGDDIAFLQYTSGSTGNPKGVMVSHDNLMDNLKIIKDSFGLNDSTIGYSWLPLYHDMGLIGNILEAIFSDFKLYFTSPFTFLRNPITWVEGISRYQVTVSGGPNFGYSLLSKRVEKLENLDLDLSSWKIAYCGAEPIQSDVLRRFTKNFSTVGFKESNFLPCYGMAESTVYISGGRYKNFSNMILNIDRDLYHQGIVQSKLGENAVSKEIVCCGKPAMELLIVHPETLTVCNTNQIGEVWVQGKSVTKGYWNASQATNEGLFAKLSSQPEGLSYMRTGDLGFLNNDNLYITGRIKDILIIRGRNYYPQDIENTIEATHEAIKLGKVAVFECNSKGSNGVGVVAGINNIKLTTSELQQIAMDIRGSIIEHHDLPVVRIALVEEKKVLRTTSGKIQRKPLKNALESGELDLLFDTERDLCMENQLPVLFAPPRNPIEIKLRNILCNILDIEIEMLGINDNFLSLGGDSLKAAEYVAKIREAFSIPATIELVIQAPTIAELGEALSKMEPFEHKSSIVVTSRNTPISASFAQKRLWFLEQLNPGTSVYNISGAVRISGTLDVDFLKKSLAEVIQRHESLRTYFIHKDDEIYQALINNDNGIIETIDVSQDEGKSSEDAINKKIESLSQYSFDLEKGPLLKVMLLKQSDTSYVIALVVHHIIADGSSIAILLNELVKLYNSYVRGEEIRLKPLPIQYMDFTKWQYDQYKSYSVSSQLDYWKKELEDAPELIGLPLDHPRLVMQRFLGGRLNTTLTPTKIRALSKLSSDHGVTLYSSLLAVFYVLLYRYSDDQDIILGTAVSGRNNEVLEDAVGFFVNTLPIRIPLDPNLTILDLMQLVQKKMLELLSNQDVSFEKVLQHINVKRCTSYQPLFQVMFNYLDSPSTPLQNLMGVTSVEEISIPTHVVKYDLTMDIMKNDETISLSLEYNSDIFEKETAQRMLSHYVNLIDSVLQDEHKKISELRLLSNEEYQTQVYQWNETGFAFPYNKNLVTLFEEQVQRTPQHIAIVDGEEQISYETLNTKANQFAHYLKKKGISKEDIVALRLNRNSNFIVCMLAVLKTGAAFLPIDFKHPLERVRFIIKDSGVKCFVSYGNDLVMEPGNTLVIDLTSLEALEQNNNNLNSDIQAHDLAYIIYTSGSTGTPKGVMIEHIGVMNAALHYSKTLHISEHSRSAQYSNIMFDASIMEIFPALLSGAALYIMPDGIRLDLEAMKRFCITNHIDHAFLPTALYHKVTKNLEWGLKNLIVAGENLTRLTTENFDIINAYGPTESTVCCTMQPCKEGMLRYPIGRPIANKKIYIVDKQLNIVPIGVVGELLIGGLGLARGYINLPADSANKFIKNPFSDDPNERLYKTGDQAYYLPDGKIMFANRIDKQVKVRGFRVELGEIEACLKKHPSIAQAIVTAKQMGMQDNVLTAYIVPDIIGLDKDCLQRGATQKKWIESVKSYLTTYLPDYMIPLDIIVMTSLPLTANGKVDYDALPALVDSEASWLNKNMPRTDLEKGMAAIWQDLLGKNNVSVVDNFFDLGGNSLLIVSFKERLQKELGWDCSVSAIYQHPTIAGLIESHNTQTPEFVDYASEAHLADDIKPQSEVMYSLWEMQDKVSIFLTGATGFVGAYIFYELANKEKTHIYFLSRAATPQSAIESLEFSLSKYGLWKQEFKDKITPVLGDIALPKLGFDEQQYNMLSNEIDIIIHSAAAVEHLASYEQLKTQNVLATEEILRLACTGKKQKFVNYCSTGTVFSPFSGSDVYNEQSSIENEVHMKSQGYSASKWIADSLCQKARDRGIYCNVFRLGLVLPSITCENQLQNNWFINLLITYLNLKCFPKILDDVQIPAILISDVATSVATIVSNPKLGNKNIHLWYGECLSFYELNSLLQNYFNCSGISMQHWLTRYIEFQEDKRNKLPLVPIFEVLKNDIHFSNADDERVLEHWSLKGVLSEQVKLYKSDISQSILKQLGIDWLAITKEYLNKFIKNQRDFLKL